MITTIQLDSEIKTRLDSLKIHHRETYNDLIGRLIINSVNNICEENTDKDSLVDTIEVMSDPELMRNLADSLEKINDSSNWVSWNKIKKDLDLNV